MPSEKVPRTSESFLSHTCAVNQLSQVKATDAEESDFKRLDDIFNRLRNERFQLRYGNVSLDTAELQVFADACFPKNKDLSSQLGYVFQ